MNKTYKIANHIQTKDNKLINNFKNSIFGAEIGIKSDNFKSVILLSTILAVGTIFLMYYFWRV